MSPRRDLCAAGGIRLRQVGDRAGADAPAAARAAGRVLGGEVFRTAASCSDLPETGDARAAAAAWR